MTDGRHDRIRLRAFELWQQEGSLDGRSLSHWLQAEQELDEDGPNPSGLARCDGATPRR
jgi:hypothetical protein